MPQQLRLILRAGAARLAAPAESVAEIVRLPLLTRAPRSPDLLLGVAQHRGQVVPVLSAAALAGGAAEAGAATHMAVLRTDPPLALAAEGVDGVEDGEAAADGRLEISGPAGVRRLDLQEAVAAAFAHLGSSTAEAPRSFAGRPLSQPAAEARQTGFLRFAVAGQPYALPLDSVLAVGRSGDELLAVAGAEPALKGLEAWRDQVIPVVDLAALLGLASSRPASRIVVDLEGRPFGLLVEAVAGVLRLGAGRIAPAPDLFNRAGGEARIAAVLRPPAGGLIALLQPADLLADARLQRWRELGEAQPPAQRQAGPTLVRRLLIELGAEIYGLPLAAVEEVVPFPSQLARPPGAAPEFLGVASLRGRAISVLDPGLRFAAPERRAPRHLVVLQARGVRAGLGVDAVRGLATFEPGQILPAPQLGAEAGSTFPEAAMAGDRLALFLDPEVLLDQAKADLIAAAAGAGGPA